MNMSFDRDVSPVDINEEWFGFNVIGVNGLDISSYNEIKRLILNYPANSIALKYEDNELLIHSSTLITEMLSFGIPYNSFIRINISGNAPQGLLASLKRLNFLEFIDQNEG